MNFINLLKVAVKALANNKFRSFLSMLGIIIGVAAVIVMMAIGQGSKESVRKNISQMGTNIIMIRPGADMRGGVRQDPSAMQTLRMEDYEAIKNETQYVTYVSPEVSSSGQVIYGSNNTNTSVYGVAPEYLDIKQWELSDGVSFTEADINSAAKVALVGKTVVDELFPEGGDVIGKTIRFKSYPIRIIGVLKSKGYNSFGMDQDNLILMPYTSVMKRILAQTYLSTINCSAITEEMTDQAIEELTAILRRNHKLKDGDDDNFTIRSQQEMMETMSSTMDSITVILVVAAAFSLLVAGIGIMNIMLASVTERTREIGIRRAIGAKQRQIVAQFLIETVVLSFTGGLFGIGVGVLIPWIIEKAVGMPTIVSMSSLVLSLGISVSVGMIFGIYPAMRAAALDPIIALRHE